MIHDFYEKFSFDFWRLFLVAVWLVFGCFGSFQFVSVEFFHFKA